MNTSSRPDNIPYPGPVWRPAVSYANTSAVSRLVTSPDMVLAQWYQATVNPGYLDSENRPIVGQNEFNRSLMMNSNRPDGLYPIVVGAEELMIRYYRQGTWEEGSLPITYFSPDLPLSPFDWLIPYGVDGICDAILFPHKENVSRGQQAIAGSGTVANTGTAVVGSGTGFKSLFNIGDIFMLQSSAYLVSSVADDTHLTLSTAPAQNLTGYTYSKQFERLLYRPAAVVTGLIDANNVVYKQGIAFEISEDQESIQWLSTSNQPAYGVRYGVAYKYRPTYEITDLGRKLRRSGGLSQLDIQAAKVWKPENLDN